LHHAWKIDESFRLELILGLPVYAILVYLLTPLSNTEWVFIVCSYLLILMIELMNTSIEQLLDKLHPEKHHMIEMSKDIAAAAVLMSLIMAAAIFAIIFLSRINL
jgi:diacylglycerol kinase (ATP)